MNTLCRRVRPLTVILAAAVQCAVVLPALRHRPDGFLYGDSHFYAATAESLWHDGDFDLLNQCFPGAASVTEVLPQLEGEPGGEFGWAQGGYLTLKQSPLLAVAALPFYAALGPPGFLLFNLVVLNLLLLGVARLGGGGPGAWAFALLALLTTPLIRFAYNYSPDLLLTALMVGALLAARANRPWVAGLCTGLAVSAKLYVAVLVLPVPLLLACAAAGVARWPALAKWAAAAALGLAPGLALNAVQFGAPWVTGYERQLKVERGAIGLADHSSRFTDPPLAGLLDLLANPRVGLVQTAPLVLLVPLAVWWLGRKGGPVPGGRPAMAACALTVVLTLALFAPYDGRDSGSAAGNRYLFPVLACGFALLGSACDRIVSAGSAASARPSRSAAQAVQP